MSTDSWICADASGDDAEIFKNMGSPCTGIPRPCRASTPVDFHSPEEGGRTPGGNLVGSPRPQTSMAMSFGSVFKPQKRAGRSMTSPRWFPVTGCVWGGGHRPPVQASRRGHISQGSRGRGCSCCPLTGTRWWTSCSQQLGRNKKRVLFLCTHTGYFPLKNTLIYLFSSVSENVNNYHFYAASAKCHNCIIVEAFDF